MGNSCRLIPDAGNGNDSVLFKDLTKRGLSRDAAKKIWAFTKTDMFKDNVPTNIEYDENGEPTIDSLSTVMDGFLPIGGFTPLVKIETNSGHVCDFLQR